MRAIKEIGGDLAGRSTHDSAASSTATFLMRTSSWNSSDSTVILTNCAATGIRSTICRSVRPNYLHDAHCRFGLRAGADVICEKPLALNLHNIDALADVEEGRPAHLDHSAIALASGLAGTEGKDRCVIAKRLRRCAHLHHVAGQMAKRPGGGSESKAGGVATNIGIHFFDMLTWLFGQLRGSRCTCVKGTGRPVRSNVRRRKCVGSCWLTERICRKI